MSNYTKQARIHTGFYRFTEIGQILQNYSEFSKGVIKKSITFPKGTRLWTPLEGTRCFGNQSPFILDPRLQNISSEKHCYTRKTISITVFIRLSAHPIGRKS